MDSQESSKNLKFVYFTPADIQVARVDRQCIVYFCEALHNLRVDIELIAMGIRTFDFEAKANNPLDLYRIKKRFPVRIVKTYLHQESSSYWGVMNRIWVHTKEAVRVLNSAESGKTIVFYSKNYASAFAHLSLRLLSRKRVLVVFEAHLLPKNAFQRFVLRNVDFIIANSFALGKDLCKENPLWRGKVMGIHQGVDLTLFNELRISKIEARKKIGLPLNKKLAVYTGKVYWGYAEVDYILKAAELLSHDVEVVIVGGRKDHVDRFREHVLKNNISNVRFVGFVPPNHVQYYQFAADVLLLYYPTGIDLNSYRSPGKLFEYMASGRPIISVDFPVLREVLDVAGIYVPPDSPDLLAQAISQILVDEKKAEALAERALSLAENYTWEERARRILQFIEGKSPRQCSRLGSTDSISL